MDEIKPPQLSIVMPAYNEEASIRGVVLAWVREVERLDIEYEFQVYDDGSSDRTGELLQKLSESNPRIRPIRQSNRGHGPTLLRGYGEARAAWVLQIDSDGEIPPTEFGEFWGRRHDFDFLLGNRRARKSGFARLCITGVSRWTVWLLFGRAIRDVNTPYRLMRRSCLERMFPGIPDDTFAPNVILSGFAARQGLRIYQQPVTFLGRTAGAPSLGGRKLWKSAFLAFRQTLKAAAKGSRTA